MDTREITQNSETDHERITRNVNELLQELRVAQAGVQILFGFLLAVAFTEVYSRAAEYQKAIHLTTVLFATAAAALLTAPAAWHRMLFRMGQRDVIVRVANVLTVCGLVCLATAMTGTVLLIADVVVSVWLAVVISVLVATGFVALWFLLPLRIRQRAEENGSPPYQSSLQPPADSASPASASSNMPPPSESSSDSSTRFAGPS